MYIREAWETNGITLYWRKRRLNQEHEDEMVEMIQLGQEIVAVCVEPWTL